MSMGAAENQVIMGHISWYADFTLFSKANIFVPARIYTSISDSKLTLYMDLYL